MFLNSQSNHWNEKLARLGFGMGGVLDSLIIWPLKFINCTLIS